MANWRVSAIQLTSTPQPTENFAAVVHYLQQLSRAYQDGLPHLVALPECFAVFGGRDGLQQQYQAPLGQGLLQQQCAALAQQFGIYLLAGSLPTASADPARFASSSIVFAPDGSIIADYQKMHLFDVSVTDNTGSYRESASTYAGQKITLATLGELKLGLSVCYDVRFPGLMQALAKQGMNLLSVPSAFTKVTGAAHWHTLLQARAIENQCFVLAPNQTGTHANGRETYGHSLIISPWGEVIADAGTAPGWISAEIDLNDCARLKQAMPLAHHNRFNSELKP
ncbi:carbon-nitrogen hydrolase family protein [Rheinheimera baltica]|uniref:Carbon-nitrogen hydrolase family protein n=1 Tax=Rheinheimera baltica TaxID=67576 RepID=A0ABT9HW32_9GAMM|nr:carbon-nitrogen hydrolase family protein [Rheinheimera baltica]MDP5135339.1 carbon-nitrogen hydrolase family protein [Rheinheimera baltica]MDP5151919.1 carbon-nitrogen hydrolase family protein [Rheinheimera baltica]